MTEGVWLPLVEVGVALIQSGERVLVVYNPGWGSFTLPMSKRRRWINSPDSPVEAWEDAAARAAAECLGRTCFPELLLEKAGVQQSNREGSLVEYRFQVFLVKVEVKGEDPNVLAPGVIGEWLMVDEILDPKRKPLSPTAVTLVNDLKSQGRL